ncbi:MAG: hypothetical protein KAW00_07120 [Dehalococcoidia bacterium]|nr:hypothetical protein [Dehalococcoidia bacterium]
MGSNYNSKDLAISIAIEAAELMELFHWVSEGEIRSVWEDLVKARHKKYTELRKDKVGQ